MKFYGEKLISWMNEKIIKQKKFRFTFTVSRLINIQSI